MRSRLDQCLEVAKALALLEKRTVPLAVQPWQRRSRTLRLPCAHTVFGCGCSWVRGATKEQGRLPAQNGHARPAFSMRRSGHRDHQGAVRKFAHCTNRGRAARYLQKIFEALTMRALAIATSVFFLTAPAVCSSQNADVKFVLRDLPREGTPSLVLTPQGAERLAAPRRSEDMLQAVFYLEAPAWSRGRAWALYYATLIACGAMGSACASLPEASRTSPTPPGSEPWRLIGCKTPPDCEDVRSATRDLQLPK
jgi:hypothetical protein